MYTRSVILAAGCGSFSPRELPIDTASTYKKRGLMYHIRSANELKGKKVLIAGGGDSAIDWALMVVPVAQEVTLIHRREQFRAHEQNINDLKKTSVRIRTPYEIVSLAGQDRLEKVTIRNTCTQEIDTIETDALVVAFGFRAALGPILDFGIKTEKGVVIVNEQMQTSMPGIFAAGDISHYPGKVKLIATGFGEAPVAVSNAKRYIDPKERLQPGHSSNLEL